MTLECICGGVIIETGSLPEFIHECNCTLCRKSGARWGYYHPDMVRIEGRTIDVVRADKPTAFAEIHSCARCGATTHFTMTKAAIASHGNTVLGVNMWLADQDKLHGVELRFPDGKNWNGEGAFGYVREPITL